ncbi:MAG: hypothetical protein AMXMBFR68_03980 [Ignavibacteria bacterium]
MCQAQLCKKGGKHEQIKKTSHWDARGFDTGSKFKNTSIKAAEMRGQGYYSGDSDVNCPDTTIATQNELSTG